MQKQDVRGEEKEVRATVVSSPLEGPHGIYFVTKAVIPGGSEESITFSLEVWREKEMPEPGTIVVLSDIREKVAGLRAHSARFSRPEDRNPKEGDDKKL